MKIPGPKIPKTFAADLPIADVLDELSTHIAGRGLCVLQAPPGAGKTTCVPLELLRRGSFEGRLIMLEPRRLAARAAAERMAEILGEPVGQTIGYRMRGDTKTSQNTSVEVVTEGILTRMIQSDPALSGIGAVVFDEFHERSLNGDLGLALIWEARSVFRPDLKLLIMSATLDAKPVAKMLDDAPIVTSQGRSFPVETKWLSRPMRRTPGRQGAPWEPALAERIGEALSQTSGSILVFLPGEPEIRRLERRLKQQLPQMPAHSGDVVIRPLYGALPIAQQRTAIRTDPTHRKIVLATAIAETSLTIEDVGAVVDAGLARRARFNPGSGMSRLVTEKVSRAEATQRCGRAGRLRAGLYYPMWSKAEHGALPAFPPAEIEATDLSGLALELAAWGATPEALAFLTPPPQAAFREAQELLRLLGALDDKGHITAHGQRLAKVPLHARLAHMLTLSGPQAPRLAALLAGRDPISRQNPVKRNPEKQGASGHGARDIGVDVSARIRALDGAEAEAQAADQGILRALRSEAKRLRRFAGNTPRSLGEMAALAYPDRIALRRPGQDARYVLSGGNGAVLDNGDPLANQRLLVALDLDGAAKDAKIRLAAPLSLSELRDIHGAHIRWQNKCEWSKRTRQVEARKQEIFGALVLDDRHWKEAPQDAVAAALLAGVRHLGLKCLNWTPAARLLRARVVYLHAAQAEDPRPDGASTNMPDWSDEGLLNTLDLWLAPYLTPRMRTASDLRGVALHDALRASLSWAESANLDAQAPATFSTPLGRDVPLDYTSTPPGIEVRLQEMFGLSQHPTIGPHKQPLKLTLLSPAHRPVQVTTDLAGFWQGSYDEVRKDMRARYPRHPWPEDPGKAEPTLRAKRRS